jgi:hypothetical protein
MSTVRAWFCVLKTTTLIPTLTTGMLVTARTQEKRRSSGLRRRDVPEASYTSRLNIKKGSKQGSHQAMTLLLDEYAAVSTTDQRGLDIKR